MSSTTGNNELETEPDPAAVNGTELPASKELSEFSSPPSLVDAGGEVILAREEAGHTTESKFIVSARTVATTATVFGLACVTALVIVATVSGAEALSTTALALAVIAFGAQLLASASQAQTTMQQSLRSEQLNAETQRLLAEMQTTARTTEQMLRDQFSQLLRAFMDAASTAGRGKDFDFEGFESRMLANMRQIAREQQESPPREVGNSPSSAAITRARAAQAAAARQPRPPAARQRQAGREAPTFPSLEEAQPVLGDLMQLSVRERSRLASYARDQAKFDSGQVSYAGYLPDTKDENLHEQGFVQLVRQPMPDGGVRSLYQLSDKGRMAGRILTGTGAVPDWAAPVVADLGPAADDDDIPF